MATEIVIIDCPAGEYTLVGEAVNSVRLQVRGQSTQVSGKTVATTGDAKFRVAIADEEPGVLSDTYWEYDINDAIDAGGSNVYIMPEAKGTALKLAVLRSST